MAGEKILVIEDNFFNQQLVRATLELAGYEMLLAEDAETGIETARAQQPALILMDLDLPRMDGLTATGLLRNDPQTKEIPIIAVTAHAMKGDREKALAAGCCDFVTKPIDVKNFIATIASHIAQK